MKLTSIALLLLVFTMSCEVKPPEKPKDSEACTDDKEITTEGSQVSDPKEKEVLEQKSALEFLKETKGKYGFDVKIFENEVIKPRLKKILGDDYEGYSEAYEVQTPIEIDNDMLYLWGMQAHSGGDPGIVFMADIKKDLIYAGYRISEKELANQ